MTDAKQTVETSPARRVNWVVFALLGGVVLLIGLLWFFSSNRNPAQDRLADNQVAAAAPDPEKRCAAQATYDLIKRELFRRAAQLRGSDQAAYDQLAAYAVLRMENPVLESQDAGTGALNCSGSASLDLPPGVTIVGGKHTLMADVDYTIQPAADGSGDVLLLKNADTIIAPLATLARVGTPASAAAPVAAGGAPVEPGTPAAPPAAAPPPSPPTPPAGRPSFNCANAQTRGENAVCSDSGLAALDTNMAAQYRRALSGATPAQRQQLQATRDRFLAYRDRCPNRQCMADAYTGRMREIRDIVEGRWQPR